MILRWVIVDSDSKVLTDNNIYQKEQRYFLVYLRQENNLVFSWPGSTTNVILRFPGTNVVKQTSDASLVTYYPNGYMLFTLTTADTLAMAPGVQNPTLEFIDPVNTKIAVLDGFINIMKAVT